MLRRSIRTELFSFEKVNILLKIDNGTLFHCLFPVVEVQFFSVFFYLFSLTGFLDFLSAIHYLTAEKSNIPI